MRTVGKMISASILPSGANLLILEPPHLTRRAFFGPIDSSAHDLPRTPNVSFAVNAKAVTETGKAVSRCVHSDSPIGKFAVIIIINVNAIDQGIREIPGSN